ncbi:hypothetical protein ACQY0O_005451 [Thecaphora frezii]
MLRSLCALLVVLAIVTVQAVAYVIPNSVLTPDEPVAAQPGVFDPKKHAQGSCEYVARQNNAIIKVNYTIGDTDNTFQSPGWHAAELFSGHVSFRAALVPFGPSPYVLVFNSSLHGSANDSADAPKLDVVMAEASYSPSWDSLEFASSHKAWTEIVDFSEPATILLDATVPPETKTALSVLSGTDKSATTQWVNGVAFRTFNVFYGCMDDHTEPDDCTWTWSTLQITLEHSVAEADDHTFQCTGSKGSVSHQATKVDGNTLTFVYKSAKH